MSVERLAALAQLLDRPDPRSLKGCGLKGRGHRLTHPGKRERWAETWLPAAQTWLAQRVALAGDDADGWKPAVTARRTFAFLRPLHDLRPLSRSQHLELLIRDRYSRYRGDGWH